jgi:acyl transferase domain-containing protein/NAD(P)-dependent dehydrogenase (short-subunit alcohol dehydrogenase family)/acyl carrier protein
MEKYTGLEIAVIGLAGRFPRAGNIAQYWDNLKNGRDCTTTFSGEELLEAGVPAELIDDPAYVRTHAYVENKDQFDAAFFDYRPDEAELMDPQLRIFHECCWEALEDSGYGNAGHQQKIALFASGSPNINWTLYSLIRNGKHLVDEFTAANIREVTFLSSRIAYKLNLTGPAIFSQTACSSSLVTIHQACSSLLLGECSMALAGGITIANYSKRGYLYEQGMIYSKSGKCRPFDIHSDGTIASEGAGVVVLKRLADAMKDGDNIYAVIKGSAINNDGNEKVGYTAPGIEGQSEVIKKAIRMAGIKPADIGYVEAHGTATELGDPIEVEALNEAFNYFGKCGNNTCAIGSVKSNMGHLDSAAGVAGFIKAVLAVKHRQIPPTLHFTAPNPKINFQDGPFYVNNELKEWKNSHGPLRAGVSSFGIGGTNAHVILEEAPDRMPSQQTNKPLLLVVSAKTAASLEANTNQLAGALAAQEDNQLADLAYTLQTGRSRFRHRRIVVCNNSQEAISKIMAKSFEEKAGNAQESLQNVIFMFSGQGSQYAGMCKDLYHGESRFRKKVDECLAIARQYSTADFYSILFPIGEEAEKATINNTRYTQPLLFIIEYALAHQLMTCGVMPHYMIGHSIGEYVAACLSGVFSLPDAIRLVIRRGELMSEVEKGSMVSVNIGAEAIMPILASFPALDLAVINSPASLVIAGRSADIETFEEELTIRGYVYRKLRTSHAFHSSMMEAILEKFEKEVAGVIINEPKIPYISNVSGEEVSYEQIKEPSYWSTQLRSTVHFLKGAEMLLDKGKGIFIELGPGRSLCNYISESRQIKEDHLLVNTVRQYAQQGNDHVYFLEKVGQLWLHGIDINWNKYNSGEKRIRLSLPAYSFEKTVFTTDVDAFKLATQQLTENKKQGNGIEHVINRPVWQQTILPNDADELQNRSGIFLLFSGPEALNDPLKKKLEAAGQKVIEVRPGSAFRQVTEEVFEINLGVAKDHLLLWKFLLQAGISVDNILYCSALTSDIKSVSYDELDSKLHIGYIGLSFLARSIAHYPPSRQINLVVVSNHLAKVMAADKIDPLKATILGPAKVIPLEIREVNCKVVDLPFPFANVEETNDFLQKLLNELHYESEDVLVAYRHGGRWIPGYQWMQENKKTSSGIGIVSRGTYVITGAMGGMGFNIARSLVVDHGANIIMVHRSVFPARYNWEDYLLEKGEDDTVSKRILELLLMEKRGCRIELYQVDVANEEQVYSFVSTLKEKYRTINGLVWAAGEVDYGGIIMNREREDLLRYIASKVQGLLLFQKHMDFAGFDFIALFSSMGNVFYHTKFGQAAYNAANEFLESYAYYTAGNKGPHIFTIDWCDWLDVGMTYNTLKKQANTGDRKIINKKIRDGITPSQGVAIFEKCLQNKTPVSMIYKQDLRDTIAQFKAAHKDANERFAAVAGLQPPASTGDDLEEKLTAMFSRFFGKEDLAPDDDFFELGLDSLKALTLIYNIQETFGIKLSFAELFKRSTIRTLSQLVESQQEVTV